MKMSIITVCHNAAQTIRDALESVDMQKGNLLEIEHIVVDGGSTDGTVARIEDFVNEAKAKGEGEGEGRRVKWVSERDRGMYDALNKGIRMATGDVIGILNADDALAADDVLAKVAEAFGEAGIDGTYADIRFVKGGSGGVETLRRQKTARYCSGRHFRPWMFRFGVQTAHPSTFFRRECFAKWGGYSLDYGMYGDFELLCRFIWRKRARMRYLPFCTTVMRLGGASTDGWRTTLRINRSDLRALRANGCRSCLPLLYVRYLFKAWGFIFKRR